MQKKELKFKVPIYNGNVFIIFTDSKDDIVDFLVNNKDYFNADFASEEDVFGTTYKTNTEDGRCVMIALNPEDEEWRLSVIAHEAIHAADLILEFAGYEGRGEPFAYLADFICEEIYNFAKKENIKIY